MKILLSLITMLTFTVPAFAAEPFPCQFDSYAYGSLESAVDKGNGNIYLTLAHPEMGESYMGTLSPEFPGYDSALQFIKASGKKDVTTVPLGAFLYSSNHLCGFTEVHTDSLYIQNMQKMYGKYVVFVCIDETSDCFTLNISPGNALFETAEEAIKPQVQQVAWTVFDTKSEIISVGTSGPQGP